MYDIIWTIIIIWLVYKLVDVFKNSSSKKESSRNRFQTSNSEEQNNYQYSSPKKDLKGALKKHLNNEGEYVDFEEVK